MVSIARRIQNCQRLLAVAHRLPNPDKDEQGRQIRQLTHMFKLLLAEKAREESVHKMCDDQGRNPENTRTREAHNA